MNTIGTRFAEIRSKKGMTMIGTAEKCGFAESTVWKIENDRPVRWETVHMALGAFRVKPTHAEYHEFHELWLAQRKEMANRRPVGASKKKLSKHGVEATRKFRILIRNMTPAKTRKVLLAAQKAAVN